MKNHYLFHIQFLGYRYHGWLKQPGFKTVQFMVDKTFEFIFGHAEFKTLGCSRTDAKVSANHFVFELFTNEELVIENFLPLFNKNLPNDIASIKIEKTSGEFNIIHQVAFKEYLYHFSHDQKNHPFAAPLIVGFSEKLDIQKMKEGANLYKGKHDFRRYCAEPKPNQNFIREIEICEIILNQLLTTNFFPAESFFLRVKSKGFLRYQVRLMMGTLFSLGKNEITLKDISDSLLPDSDIPMRNIAPSSGLILNKVEFN